ncbi:MAG: hypothetical protein A3F74_27550 [Betaproteobacteria bacterium RIFCSPLOWO2_12_FULL_62_58]|nr:MAG: hypothetical protein A3F74_27550 [Betaproteobacteria bacterium RIFCSPLOWO2_12_FULL_62_58]
MTESACSVQSCPPRDGSRGDVLQAPDTRTTLATYGLTTTSNTPDQFAQIIKSEIAKWTELAQKMGIHAE